MDTLEIDNGALVEPYRDGITIDRRIYSLDQARELRDWLLDAFPLGGTWAESAERFFHNYAATLGTGMAWVTTLGAVILLLKACVH